MICIPHSTVGTERKLAVRVVNIGGNE